MAERQLALGQQQPDSETKQARILARFTVCYRPSNHDRKAVRDQFCERLKNVLGNAKRKKAN